MHEDCCSGADFVAGTRAAAEQAGIAADHELQLMSEPEAAAIYCLKVQDTQSVKVGDRVVVCDAGGGG